MLRLAAVVVPAVASLAVPCGSPSKFTVNTPVGGESPGFVAVTVPVTVNDAPDAGVIVDVLTTNAVGLGCILNVTGCDVPAT